MASRPNGVVAGRFAALALLAALAVGQHPIEARGYNDLMDSPKNRPRVTDLSAEPEAKTTKRRKFRHNRRG